MYPMKGLMVLLYHVSYEGFDGTPVSCMYPMKGLMGEEGQNQIQISLFY